MVFGLVLIWVVISSAYELVRRTLKPNDVYACKITSENGKLVSSTDLISIRVFWPVDLPSLWVKHSGWATVGQYNVPTVYEGSTGRDHILSGVDYDKNNIFLSLDRVTGKVFFKYNGSYEFEGTCT